MFGYIMVDDKQLSSDELARYRQVYCGVCHSLKEGSGQLCRLALTYDMSFLALLLDSLYEPVEQAGTARCAAQLAKPVPFSTSIATEHAADATVVLAYHKLLDDYHDDGKLSRRAMAELVTPAYRQVSKRRPALVDAVEAGMADIAGIEAAHEPSLDAAAARFGEVLGAVFALCDDFWAPALRKLGFYLGKFVYLMDAALDYEDDRRTGSYNPLLLSGVEPQDMREAFLALAAAAAAEFEKLPCEQDVNILRNVLYVGIWGQYVAKFGAEGLTGTGKGPVASMAGNDDTIGE